MPRSSFTEIGMSIYVTNEQARGDKTKTNHPDITGVRNLERNRK